MNGLSNASASDIARSQIIDELMSGRECSWQGLVDRFKDANLVDSTIITLRDDGHIASRDSSGPYPVAIWKRVGV